MATLLKKNGYALEYEKKIDFQPKIKTPDWFVSASEVNPEFIVEVFTTYTGSDEQTQSENLQIELLKKRLEKIIFDGILQIKCDTSNLNDGRSKKIAERMKLILINKTSTCNFDYKDEDLDFEYTLIQSNIGLPSLKVVIGESLGRSAKRDTSDQTTQNNRASTPLSPRQLSRLKVISESFREISQDALFRNVSEKNKKYKDGDISFVIAAFTDMGISQLIRKENYKMIIDHLKDKTSISAFVWIDRVHPSVDGWTINIIYNTKSNLKLQNIFKNEKYVFSNSDIVHKHVVQKIDSNRSEAYDIAQKELRELNFELKLKNILDARWYCHWTTPITRRCEIVIVT
jgi:hypothetical protein